jgi:hypothetical protein
MTYTFDRCGVVSGDDCAGSLQESTSHKPVEASLIGKLGGGALTPRRPEVAKDLAFFKAGT